MEHFYEYKIHPNRKLTWFAASCIGFLVGFGILTTAPHIHAVVWSLVAVCFIWLLMKSPAAGIRVDEYALTLAAFRKPRAVPLSQIDHMEIQHWTDESDVKIVFRDGREEMIPYGDLPSMNTFSEVMVAFGVRLTEPAQAFNR